ncbi:DUF1211 domain-containing protein [Patescibacteria group bacterium]|nr:DUF1211 domain-containing protein [Patescibacteria group bacterium]
MKPSRLEQLSDGIFAIVMTILVFDLKVPEVATSNTGLAQSLVDMLPFFLSYVLSFSMLFTYWRAHHFFISVYAKNIDMTLTNINALFFLFVSIVPFTTSLLGRHSDLQLSVIVFSVNVILIGMCLHIMRDYVFNSPSIKNIEVSKTQISHGTARMLIPMIFALIAIPLCFWNKDMALALLTIAILFNFSSASTAILNKFL